MIGSTASASRGVGNEFMAHDGYISGKNVELTPGKMIRQTWRTQEFDASDADSELQITLEPEGSGTRLTLNHTNLPDHGMQYEQGWKDHYFAPMTAYFQQ